MQYGVDLAGLSREWAMLSSAMGTYLGALLLWAGIGWRRGRPTARLATWMYATCGFATCATDIFIFTFVAHPGWRRVVLLLVDGAAIALPVVLAGWLIAHRKEKEKGV